MRRLTTVVLLAVGLTVSSTASPARASWVSEHCDGTHFGDVYVKRSEAQAYASVANDEGYEWGGGCWNDNDKDDTPNAPDSNGEGADCSGLTFKTWELENKYGKAGFEYWERLYNVHGPYTSYDYHAPTSSAPFYKLANKKVETTIYMDAFAKEGHIGMLYVDSGSPDGLDLIIEALGDSSGMGKFYENYRNESEYVAIRREDWTDDCFPNCSSGPSVPVPVP
jgi:hypothetical protein